MALTEFLGHKSIYRHSQLCTPLHANLSIDPFKIVLTEFKKIRSHANWF